MRYHARARMPPERVTNNVAGMIFLIAVWQMGSMFTTPIFLPGPAAVVRACVSLILAGQLQIGLMYTTARIFIATLLSICVAIPIALMVYISSTLQELFMPVISMFRFIPVTAFSPMLILWTGIGEKFKIAFIFCATFVYVLPSVVMALREVPKNMIEAGKALGMNRYQIATDIVLRMAAPSIAESCLMMIGIGFTYVAVTEAVNAKYGLGHIINQASARGKMSICFAAVIAIMLASYIFDMIGSAAIHKVFKWKYE